MKLELDAYYTAVLERALHEYIMHTRNMEEAKDAGTILGMVAFAKRRK